MNNLLSSKSSVPLQLKAYHTLIGLVVLFALITIPAECQMINIFGMQVTSEILWWPVVIFILYLIYHVYGFSHFRHAIHAMIIFRVVYILFLNLAIILPSSSFWNMQEVYTSVLGRGFLYTLKSTLLVWLCILFPVKLFGRLINEDNSYLQPMLFLFNLIIFTVSNKLILNANHPTTFSECIISACFIFSFLLLFFNYLTKTISRIEKIPPVNHMSKDLKLGLPTTTYMPDHSATFKYHHILFCSSIVFFIASKTMASKFITMGSFTINVGGIVFSLAYLASDIMTDVYGIERTKQMIYFIILCNLIFVFDVWITNYLATNQHGNFSKVLHNQTRMFIASALAFFFGMTINSSVISIIKNKQRKRGISLKREFITTVWIRVATSSAFGIVLDVSLFSFFAFSKVVPSDQLANIVIFEDLYKISYEIALAPLSVLLIFLLKVREKVDIYDQLSNFNPFIINTNYNINANKFKENYLISPKDTYE